MNEPIEILIPDNEGNHLVVVLNFYDDTVKANTFQIPFEFSELDVVDISISKIDLDKPLGPRAFFEMCRWLLFQLQQFHNAIFSFVCSMEELKTNHPGLSPAQYRWNLFERLYLRNVSKLESLEIDSKDIIVGPEGFQTFARVFYHTKHAPIIHIVIAQLQDKYSD